AEVVPVHPHVHARGEVGRRLNAAGIGVGLGKRAQGVAPAERIQRGTRRRDSGGARRIVLRGDARKDRRLGVAAGAERRRRRRGGGGGGHDDGDEIGDTVLGERLHGGRVRRALAVVRVLRLELREAALRWLVAAGVLRHRLVDAALRVRVRRLPRRLGQLATL